MDAAPSRGTSRSVHPPSAELRLNPVHAASKKKTSSAPKGARTQPIVAGQHGPHLSTTMYSRRALDDNDMGDFTGDEDIAQLHDGPAYEASTEYNYNSRPGQPCYLMTCNSRTH